MKTLAPLQKLGIVCLPILLLSCSATNRLTMNVTQPAPVIVPKNIERIGVLSRFNYQSGSILSEIDKVFTAEGKMLDYDASNELIKGLSSVLAKNNRFDVTVIEDSLSLTDYTHNFPTNLSWEAVDDLCEKYDVDALYVLSFFDTDSKINYTTKQAFTQNVLGIKVPVLEHHATSNTLIKGGFRIYHPANKLILDAYPFEKAVTVSGKGVNPTKAVEALKLRKDVVMDASRVIGETYALNIEPYTIRVARDYFVKGTDRFEVAKRRAQTGDWNGAAELWEMELQNPKSKIAGRACYNMAIINEINGDLNSAMDWASKSYTDYRNKDALRYLNILKYRIAQNERLALQHL